MTYKAFSEEEILLLYFAPNRKRMAKLWPLKSLISQGLLVDQGY